MKIFYLHAELMGYSLSTIAELAVNGHEIHIVHWDHKKLTPFSFSELYNVHIYKRSEYTTKEMRVLIDKIKPDLMVVSGWMDNGYLVISKYLRGKKIPVIVGFDDQWHYTPKQLVAYILGKIGFFSLFFSHAWVAGVNQFEYARKLGFKKSQISFNLYSADLNLFNDSFFSSIENKKALYPRRFLFVGRLEKEKGLDILIEAWNKLSSIKGVWELQLIGSGSLNSVLSAIPGVAIKPFMQPEQLVQEIANSGCFILPSRFEPWGVVVHELAASGLPIITSNVVGSATEFLIKGYNGFEFEVNDASNLAEVMFEIIKLSDEELIKMGSRSHELAQRISPSTSAFNLLSVFKN
jgi:glycosyltransferase involved in cell wall biosynthesis